MLKQINLLLSLVQAVESDKTRSSENCYEGDLTDKKLLKLLKR